MTNKMCKKIVIRNFLHKLMAD